MKRFKYIFLLMTIAMLSSCSNDPLPETDRQPMGFSPAVSVETKSSYREKPDDPSMLIAVGKQISLFGIRVVNEGPGETKTTLFDNRLLECTQVTNPSTFASIWDYESPLEYWEQTGLYYFAGVFPFISNSADITNNNGLLNITYRAGEINTDLMVARAYRDVESADGTTPVPLTFNHACSAIRVLFGTDAGANVYALNDFQIESVARAGTLRVPSRLTENPAIISSNWSYSNPGILFHWEAEDAADRIPVANPSDVDDPEEYTQMGWYYMVPQTLNANSAIRFSVSYNGQPPVTTLLNISDCDGEPGYDTWIPNMVYNYFITLTQSGMYLRVETTPWDKVQVTTDIVTFEPS